MSKPWETIDDRPMQMIINEMIKLHKEYKDAKKKTMKWLLISYIPLLGLLYQFYTKIEFNLTNIFATVFGNISVILLLLIYLGFVAKVKVCMSTEKEAKKDYKDLRYQVTDNFNTIWRYDYGITKCNEIVDVLDKEFKINICYKD